MKRPQLLTWWIVFAALTFATAGLWYLLSAQGAAVLSTVVYLIGSAAGFGWMVTGLVWWQDNNWVAKLTRFLLLTAGAGVLVGFCLPLGYDNAAIVFAGAWGMAVTFMLGFELLRLAFSPGYGVLGVARTLLDEAVRMKLALIFVVMLVLLVPVLPFMLGGETRLQYRMESFLTYSLTLITTLLSLMTILLAVRTVSSELTERQVFLTLTKPVSRAGYLLGKWLGIMGLNLVLLVVSAVGVIAFIKVLERTPAMDLADAVAVQEQVLTARSSASPVPVNASALALDYEERLRDLRLRGADPLIYGNVGDPITVISDETKQAIRLNALKEWLTIAPRNQATYRFAGLERAKDLGASVQLRFKPAARTAAGDNMVRLAFRVNDRPYADPRNGSPLPPIRNDTFHTAYFLSEDIRDNGTLDLTIINTGAELGQSAVSFKPNEGLEIFYKVRGFETNLASGLIVMWVRLGFLAMLGLAAATFLGFPTACLACFLVFITAVGSDYVGNSLLNYASIPRDQVPWWDKIWLTVGKFGTSVGEGEFYDAFKLVIRLVGGAFTFVVPPMSQYSPTSLIAYGRAVEGSMLLGAFVRLGVVSTGIVGLFAAFVFGRREVAQVTV
ncbi:MAG: ABC transporter permease subunit [Planctomycetota bacterium]